MTIKGLITGFILLNILIFGYVYICMAETPDTDNIIDKSIILIFSTECLIFSPLFALGCLVHGGCSYSHLMWGVWQWTKASWLTFFGLS